MRVLEMFINEEKVRKVIYGEMFGKVVAPATTTIYNKRGSTARGRSQSHYASIKGGQTQSLLNSYRN